MTSPVTASAGGAEPLGVVRFASEPASYWRDSSGPILLAQATPADSGAHDKASGSDTAGAPPSASPPPGPAPSTQGTKVSPSPSATSDSGSSAQVLPVTPTPTPEDTLHTAPGTTVPATTAPHDSLHTTVGTLPDSLHTRATVSDSLHARSTAPETLRATSARPETLFAPPPHGVGPKPTTPAAATPKQRTGIWGVSPIAILLALAVVHYFVTKSVD